MLGSCFAGSVPSSSCPCPAVVSEIGDCVDAVSGEAVEPVARDDFTSPSWVLSELVYWTLDDWPGEACRGMCLWRWVVSFGPATGTRREYVRSALLEVRDVEVKVAGMGLLGRRRTTLTGILNFVDLLLGYSSTCVDNEYTLLLEFPFAKQCKSNGQRVDLMMSQTCIMLSTLYHMREWHSHPGESDAIFLFFFLSRRNPHQITNFSQDCSCGSCITW